MGLQNIVEASFLASPRSYPSRSLGYVALLYGMFQVNPAGEYADYLTDSAIVPAG
jgi:hypothetical protein